MVNHCRRRFFVKKSGKMTFLAITAFLEEVGIPVEPSKVRKCIVVIFLCWAKYPGTPEIIMLPQGFITLKCDASMPLPWGPILICISPATSKQPQPGLAGKIRAVCGTFDPTQLCTHVVFSRLSYYMRSSAPNNSKTVSHALSSELSGVKNWRK